MDLQKKVLDYKEEVIKGIQGAVQIKSVQEPAKEGKPFGDGPAEALQYFLDLGKELGFKVENFDNYAGTIEFGEGEETVGILGHVDVVPEGEGWIYPPYSATITDGKIFGRGTLDDKGPSMVCLYAMKAIKDSGVKLNRKIRMIIGANEETGSLCMEHYFNTLKMPQPTLAFTPDSSFPVTFAEKGIVRVKLSNSYKTLNDVTIKGGNAYNSVPDRAEAVLPVEFAEGLAEKAVSFNEGKEFKVEVEVKDGRYHVASLGKSSHAARPAQGYNSISALFAFLGTAEIKNEELKGLVEFFKEYIKMENNGASFGIDFKDEESGSLTLNLGKMSLENGKLELCIDMRCPVLVPNTNVIDTLKEKTAGKMELEVTGNSAPLYVAKDSFLVSTLMDIYKEITGDVDAQPVAIGGGTYAREVTNGVAFGALLSSQENNMHQKNEYLEIDKIDTWLKIYVEAIYRLAK
ncbi:dipeptidase PepV [Fusobacterium ulcerans]|uniref:Dipeptidase n=1 Tax=Fusobacterium ulcerans 12-1B TaxID=457404 RepID=H1PTX7_9FUSO|nr:dipeptidase PepV [Fusobacterium ulcerans]EHO80797.1 hypothetical protein HMPREF0402_01870 [Fusobacterium ulcerans 12-1B]